MKTILSAIIYLLTTRRSELQRESAQYAFPPYGREIAVVTRMIDRLVAMRDFSVYSVVHRLWSIVKRQS